MKSRCMLILAVAVIIAAMAPMAVQAVNERPLTDNEVLIGERSTNDWDCWDYTGDPPAVTQVDYIESTQVRAIAWGPDMNVGGVTDGVPDMFVIGGSSAAQPPNRIYVWSGASKVLVDAPNNIITDGINDPRDLCVRGDYLYVLNDGNNTVTRYNKMTRVRDTSWSITGLPETPLGIAVTADGSVYIACGYFDPNPYDAEPGVVGMTGLQKYNAAGTFVGAIAADVDGAGFFFGVREDWEGNLWVTSSRVDHVDPETEEEVGISYVYKINPKTQATQTIHTGDFIRLRQLGFTKDRTAIITVDHEDSFWYRIQISDGAVLNEVFSGGAGSPSGYMEGSVLTTFNRDGTDLPPFGAVTLPTVGASNKAMIDSIMTAAASQYNWVLWGKVSERSADAFKIDDGSGVVISVVAIGNTVADDDYVSVKGIFDKETDTLTSESVTKHSP